MKKLILPLMLLASYALPAQALTMREAAQLALEHDPRMLATRSAVDASVAVTEQAAAGYRPSVVAAAQGGHTDLNTAAPFPQSGPRWSNTASLSVTQPLYMGGGLDARSEAAQLTLDSTRQSQRDTGGKIILATLTAYADVLRDRTVVSLSETNVKTLEQASSDTTKRTDAGEATHTDEAQAQARLAEARANLKRASAQLRVSTAAFTRLTGVAPDNLSEGWPQPVVPTTLAEAIRLSASAPAVLAAQINAEAAKKQIDIIGADALPKVSLDGSAVTQDNTEFGYDRLNEWIVQLKISMPLYEGGLVSARKSEAGARAEQTRQLSEDTRQAFAEAATQEWEMLQATQEVIRAYESEKQAAELALDGTRKELDVGTRTTLDLLNAERELLSAQVSLVGSQRDRTVLAFKLLAACGQLETTAIPQ
jgi:outer membrane protein